MPHHTNRPVRHYTKLVEDTVPYAKHNRQDEEEEEMNKTFNENLEWFSGYICRDNEASRNLTVLNRLNALKASHERELELNIPVSGSRAYQRKQAPALHLPC